MRTQGNVFRGSILPLALLLLLAGCAGSGSGLEQMSQGQQSGERSAAPAFDPGRVVAHNNHGGCDDDFDDGCRRPAGPLAELNLFSGRSEEQLGSVSLSIDEQQNLVVRLRLSGTRRELGKVRLFIGPDAPRSHKSGDNRGSWQKQMRQEYRWGPFAHEMCRPRMREDTFRIPLRDIEADCGGDCSAPALQYYFAVYAEGSSRSGGHGHNDDWEAYGWTSAGRVRFPGQQWRSYDQRALLFPACVDTNGGGGGNENQPPVADLQSDVNGGNKPLSVQFDASASADPDGLITDYEWDFDGDGSFNEAGDESAARGQARPAAVTYGSVGTYNASVRVSDSDGAEASDSRTITVTNGGPTADLQAAPLSGDKPLTVSFDASGSSDSGGSITDFEWDFDADGSFNEPGVESDSRGDAAPLPVTYLATGNYDVTVRVTDDDGVSATATRQITVSNAAPLAQLVSDVSSGLKPLVVNFSAAGSSDPGGLIVNYEWDFDGDGIFSEGGDEALAEGSAIPVSITYSQVGVYPAAVRVTDDDGAQASDSVSITVNNSPPQARLSASETWGDIPMTVSFDASASSDPGGMIDDYEWDLDGNGSFNESGFEADSRGFPQASFAYTQIGTFNVTLRVTDDDGAQASASLQVSAGAWGSGATLDSAGFTGYHNSLALIAGLPAIAYFDNSNDDLRFVRALDPAGAAWGAPQTVDSAGSVGEYCSLAEVGGFPAMAYYDNTNDDLRFVRALDSAGTSWGSPLVLDAAGNTGQYCSLSVISGNPAVSYFDVTNGDLRYVRALDGSGSAWGAAVTIDASGTTGQFSSLLEVNGRPAVSYHDASGTNLRYVRALDSTGAAWGTGQTLDSAGTTGLYTSLALIGGFPAIAFQHGGNGDLRYVRALNSDGSAWGAAQNIDTAGVTGLYASLEEVFGRPAIAYYDNTAHDLRYVRALDGGGSAWGTALTLDSANFTGAFCSLAVLANGPAVAYQNVTDADLRFIRHLP